MKRITSPLYAAASVLALGAGSAALAEEGVAPTLVITASPLASPIDELAAPVTVVTREEILASPATSIGGLLADKPGIAASSFAAGASRPIIRGLDNTRVRVQENGIGAGDVSTVSEDHAVPIDPLSAKRVEVVRGPAVLRYGSEAIGGVVNVINNRIPTTMPKGGFEGEASTAYDHVNYGRQGYADLNVATGNVVWHVDTFARKTGNYLIPNQPTKRQQHTWTESAGVAGGASVLLENGYIGGSISHYDSEYGIPAPEDPNDPLRISLWQTRFQGAAEFEFSGGPFSGFKADAGYSEYSHGELDAGGSTESRFDNREGEVRAELLHRAVGPFTGALGVHFRKREVKAAGEGGELLAPAHSEALAGFVFEEMPVTDSLKLQFGGRIERVEVKGTALDIADPLNPFDFAVSRSFTPVSGSLGLVQSLGGGWVVGATAQHVERAPDLQELFSKGPHEATETFEVGDPTFGKEKARSFEINARREGEDFSFEAALFHTSFDDFIYKQLTGEECDDDGFDTCTPHGTGDELDQVFFRQQDATFRGFEAAASATVLRWATGRAGVTGQFDMVRAKLDAGGNVPRIPPMRAGAGVFFEEDRISGQLGFLHAFKQDRIEANETETGSYTNVRAELRYKIMQPTDLNNNIGFEFAVVGENLLNEEIRHHSSFKKNDVLQPGRNIRLVATARF